MTRYTKSDLRDLGRCPDCGYGLDDCRCEPDDPTPEPTRESSAAPSAGHEVEFRAERRPHAKRRPKLSTTESGKPHSYEDPETADYEQWIGHVARDARPEGWPRDAEYALYVRAVYPDGRVGDLSNVVKAIEDGCEGVLWYDDRDVVEIRATRSVERSADDGWVRVRIEVTTTKEA